MIITYIYLLVLACVATALPSSEFSLKGDPCSEFDSCSSKQLPKTCSCESACELYGTCCHDFETKTVSDASFGCYHRRASPVFAKRSCSKDFKGHIGDKAACLDEDEDEMDVKANLLVTSHKTKITYWNKICAKCNNEAEEDLEFWNIEVLCPKHENVNKDLIRRNLTFDQDKNDWGLHIDGEFLRCIVKYAQPTYIEEVKHCTPNLISSCPANYSNEEISLKCSQYYAERKLKNSETFYKNVHCAMCNSVHLKDLECPGISTSDEDNGEEIDFREMVEDVLSKDEWYQEKTFMCSKGHVYNPSLQMCRKYEYQSQTAAIPNSANIHNLRHLSILAIVFVFLY